MFCRNCGSEIDNNAFCCPNCGNLIKKDLINKSANERPKNSLITLEKVFSIISISFNALVVFLLLVAISIPQVIKMVGDFSVFGSNMGFLIVAYIFAIITLLLTSTTFIFSIINKKKFNLPISLNCISNFALSMALFFAAVTIFALNISMI